MDVQNCIYELARQVSGLEAKVQYLMQINTAVIIAVVSMVFTTVWQIVLQKRSNGNGKQKAE